MKKAMILLYFILQMTSFVCSEEIVISVSDFTVASENRQYKHIGKGIARLLAGELKNVSEVKLVERERLNLVLQEQEFGLSDLADPSKQIEVGKLLSANYIVIGEVIDMLSSLVTSVRLVNATTGEVIFEDELTEQLEKYDYISAYFAKAILQELHLIAGKETIAKINKEEKKHKEAIISLSEGIDAIDRGKTEEARAQLENAKRLDPTNKVINEYLAKLIVNTTKFKVMTENCFSYQNPAFLAIMQTDRFHATASVPLWALMQTYEQIPDRQDLYLQEVDTPMNIGYWFPVGRRSGFGIEIFSSSSSDRLTQGGEDAHYSNGRNNMGAIVSAGSQITELLAAGISASIYGENTANKPPFYIDEYSAEGSEEAIGLSGGILVRNSKGNIFFDARIGWSSGSYFVINDYQTYVFLWPWSPERNDQVRSDLFSEHVLPLFFENTLTINLRENSTFLVIKQLDDVYLDRRFYFGSILPVIENYFATWLSLRAGFELSYTIFGDSGGVGYGAVGGITIRVVEWKLDIDLNATYRMRPSRVVEGMMYSDILLLLNLNLNDRFLSRKQL
jgi:TolB-like protein